MGETEPARGTGVAILGYGAIADFHAKALRSAGANLLVVAGPKRVQAAEFAERHGIPSTETDPQRAIEAKGVEAVVIASPSQVHAEQSRAALEAGRHVLVEIPLALRLAEAERLVDQAAQAQRTLMVCHTLRYWEPFRAAREAMRAGGWRATNVIARGLSLRHENVGWTGRHRSWTDDLLWHHGGHIVDVVLGFLDAPITDVSAEVGPIWERSGLPMDYAIALRTAEGGVATISLSYHARLGASDYTIIGETDTIVIAGAEVRSSQGPVVPGERVDVAQEAAIVAQDLDFLECIATGRRPMADAASVLPAMRVLQAVWDRAPSAT
jgi:2-hydroxy-4-carboxymuconate semialdehyde hemiacetal dehydrogenase